MIALLLAAAAVQPPEPDPKTWVEQVYAAYAAPGFSPLDRPEDYFAARLAAAIREDAGLAGNEPGHLDGDPICQCQDAGGLRAAVGKVVRSAADRASVHVAISLTGYAPRPVRFSLVRTQAGWRIADVWSADQPSLLRAIEKLNRERGKRP